MKHTTWRTLTLGGGLMALLLAAGCAKTRSISNAGFSEGYGLVGGGASRELSEFDVLGIEPERPVSEEEIAQASAHAQRVTLKPGSTLLVVQSGAAYPDGKMLGELEKHFTVVPFSGEALPPKQEPAATPWTGTTRNVAIVTDATNPVTVVPLQRYQTAGTKVAERKHTDYARMLRLAAARGGAETIVCYWGILESANENFPTKTISWVPVVNWLLPDERQHTRIRVKLAVIDVRSGSWTMVSPEPLEDTAWSTSPRREAVDFKQVEGLKAKAYAAGVKELVEKFAN